MIRSESEWIRLFEDQAQSGLSAAAYCREHKLCAKNFNLRRRQLGYRPQASLSKKAVSAFVEVKPATSRVECIELKQGSLQLRVPLSVSANWLATLVNELQ